MGHLPGVEQMGFSAQGLADQDKVPTSCPQARQFRRRQDVVFLADGLPLRETLEELFVSDCANPVELFHFTFAEPSTFAATLSLVHQVQKNFKGYRLAQFLYTPGIEHIDAAYAAGIEIIDLPLRPLPDQQEAGRHQVALRHARTLFARWMVVVSLSPHETSLATDLRVIDELLDEGVLPLLHGPAAEDEMNPEWLPLHQSLAQRWQHRKVNLRPLAPLLLLCAPLLAGSPRRGLNGLLERANETSQRAAADLRRLLRVRGAEQSFDSAAL
jgi:hypothetical protein